MRIAFSFKRRHCLTVSIIILLFSGFLIAQDQQPSRFLVVTWNAENGSTLWRLTLPDEHITEIATFERHSDDSPADVLPPTEYAIAEGQFSLSGAPLDLSEAGMRQTFIHAEFYDESHLVVMLLKQVCTRPEACFGVYDLRLMNIDTGESRLLDRQPYHHPDIACHLSQFGAMELSPRRDALVYTLFSDQNLPCSRTIMVDLNTSSVHLFDHADHSAWSPDGDHFSYSAYLPCEDADCPVELRLYTLATDSESRLVESIQYRNLPLYHTWLDNATLLYTMRDPDEQGDVPQTLYTHDFVTGETRSQFPSPISASLDSLFFLHPYIVATTYDRVMTLAPDFPHAEISELALGRVNPFDDHHLITPVENGRFMLVDSDLQTTAYDFSGLFPESESIRIVAALP